ncbi:MAG: ethylbenzene dehydrogenase-related protein [Bacteroidota bacterium]
MKPLQSKLFWVSATLILALGYLISCTKNNQVLTTVSQEVNSSELLSYKTATAPVIDGTIDAAWDNATRISVVPQVPDPGNGLFAGYSGETYPANIRSMYDGQYIYFLFEWNDPTNNIVQPWYFNPVTKLWAQKANAKQYDVNGVLLKEGMGQDQLAMLWNIDNSTPKFVTQTCYASCHLFSPYRNYAGQMVANKSGNHYTNGAAEKIDMWWCHLNKDLLTNQMDDQYQDWAGGPSVTDTVGGSGNGRHADDLIPPSPFSTSYINTNSNVTNGAFNNTQSLKLDGTGTAVNVPKWVIPDATGKLYYTTADTLAGGAAKKITGVSSTGVLTYAGGTIDPNGQTAYYEVTGTTASVGAKCIPSFVSAGLTAGRSDITAAGKYTGTGWVLEIKRLLKTPDVLKQDIDFSSLQDQPFGLAIFNSSNYQHGIRPNLLLKFQK